MSDRFWINITKSNFFYVVEKCYVGEDRIVYVKTKKCITKRGAIRHSRRCIIYEMCKEYIKEK